MSCKFENQSSDPQNQQQEQVTMEAHLEINPLKVEMGDSHSNLANETSHIGFD